MSIANKKEANFTDFFTAGIRLITQNNPIGVIYLLLAIVFSGTEAVKIIFRHKFKEGTVGVRQIVTTSLLLGGWAYLCYYLKPEQYPDELDLDNKGIILEISMLFYSILSVFVLIKGIIDFKESDSGDKGTSLGESTILGFLRSPEWNEERIKHTAEPLLLVAIGFLLSVINIYLGAPLLFLGVSSFIFYLFDPKIEPEMTVIKNSVQPQDFEDSAK